MDVNTGQGSGGASPLLAGFDTVRRLGAGAAGTVWLVRAHDGQTLCAAKCLPVPATPPTPDTSRHNESQLTREWQVLATLDHEHLVKVHGVAPYSLGPVGGGWHDGVALLMDFAAGGSVFDVVTARGPLGVGETVTVLTPMGQVLSFLHGQGVIHGDVSPGNVLFTAEGKPVLGDLGLATVFGESRGHLGGTPGFSRPDDEQDSAASDVFALAAVGWFALTGQAPPATSDRLPLSTYVPDVPHELVAALEAGLSEDARARPTAAAFAQAVFRSARAEAIALALSVHPSVLPELLTRQERGRHSHPGRRPLMPWRPRMPWRRKAELAQLWEARAKESRPQPKENRSRAGGFHRWSVLAAVMVLLGTSVLGLRALAANHSAGERQAGPSASPAAGPSPAGPPPAGQPSVAHPSTGQPATSQSASSPAAPDPRVALGAVASGIPADVGTQLVAADPLLALPALAWVRSYALTSNNEELLAAVTAAGSPAMAADRALVRTLRNSAHRLGGLETTLSNMATIKAPEHGPDPRQALVRATVTTSPFAEQDAHGTVVHRQADPQHQELRFLLVRVASRWVIQEILPDG